MANALIPLMGQGLDLPGVYRAQNQNRLAQLQIGAAEEELAQRPVQRQREAETAAQKAREAFRKSAQQVGRAMWGVKDDAGWQSALAGLESLGEDVSKFKGKPYDPNTVNTLKSIAIDPDKIWENIAAGATRRNVLTGETYTAPEKGAGMPFQGTSMDAQTANILLKGDPATPEYRAAYNLAAQEKNYYDNQTGKLVQVKPDMSAYRLPAPSAPPSPGAGRVSTVDAGDPKLTEAQGRAALFADRMQAANDVLSEIDKEGVKFWARVAQVLPGGVGNYLQSPEFQKFDQAERDFVNAVLRRESGAVISAEEFANARRQYFPQPGDGPDVMAQKAKNRQIALTAIAREGGPAYKPTPSEGGATAPTRIKDDADYNRLPSGAMFIGPDGVTRKKP